MACCCSNGQLTLLAHTLCALQEATEEAVAVAKQLAQQCIALGKELRGTDLLAERVKRLRASMEQLDAQISRVL